MSTDRADAAALDDASPLRGRRGLFDLPDDTIYLCGNSLGPLPRTVPERVNTLVTEQWAAHLAAYGDTWELLRKDVLEQAWSPEVGRRETADLLDSRENLRRRLRRTLKDPRLRLLASHPFDVDGHGLRDVPAWAGVLGHLEQRFGVWHLPGGMAALIGPTVEDARAICEEAAEGEILSVANINAPGQIVIAGTKAAIDRAIVVAKAHGVRRALPLPVSAPFHCPLMQPAAEAMRDALAYVVLEAPVVPVFANVTAQPETDPDTIRNQLVEQVTGMVRWRESVANMFDAGVHDFVEIGGKVLGPMVKRIAPDATVTSVATIEDVEAVAKEIA